MSIKYRIKWHGIKGVDTSSFYKKMTRIGPMFGAIASESPVFDTKQQAQDVVNTFPAVPACCSDIEEFDTDDD